MPTAGAGDESFGFHRAALADPAVRAKFTEAATYRFPQEAIARLWNGEPDDGPPGDRAERPRPHETLHPDAP